MISDLTGITNERVVGADNFATVRDNFLLLESVVRMRAKKILYLSLIMV